MQTSALKVLAIISVTGLSLNISNTQELGHKKTNIKNHPQVN